MAAGAMGRLREEHRHAAGVCPFCLRDRLSRLSAAAASGSGPARAGANASASASPSSASSPCSSWEETVALSSARAPRPRRGSLGLLLQQEGREAAALASGRRAGQAHGQREEQERTARRGSNFWARLQQQLHNGGWHRKDGCSAAAEKQGAPAAAAPHRRVPVV